MVPLSKILIPLSKILIPSSFNTLKNIKYFLHLLFGIIVCHVNAVYQRTPISRSIHLKLKIPSGRLSQAIVAFENLIHLTCFEGKVCLHHKPVRRWSKF